MSCHTVSAIYPFILLARQEKVTFGKHSIRVVDTTTKRGTIQTGGTKRQSQHLRNVPSASLTSIPDSPCPDMTGILYM